MIASLALAAALSAAPSGSPVHSAPALAGDPAVMALAAQRIGKGCRWSDDTYGPQFPGFLELKDSGQPTFPEGTVVIRRRGEQRVAFMVAIDDKRCTVVDVKPLPAKAPREAFLQCEVADPDPFKNTPLSQGLGLRQNGRKALVAFLEPDWRGRRLLVRDGDDPRLRCSAFESGD